MSTPSLARRLYFLSAGIAVLTAVPTLYVIGQLRIPVRLREVGVQVWVVDALGNVLHSEPPGEPLPHPWEKIVPPDAAYRPKLLRQSTVMNRDWMFRISESPERWLIFRPRIDRRQILAMLGFLSLPMLWGLNLLYVLALVYYARRRGSQIQQVVSRLKGGDLRARFEVTQLDEVGRSMQSFNEMADEIERLVERVRAEEAKRRQLLRELAHDVRTPLTSLSYLMETVARPHKPLGKKQLGEKMAIAMGELDYFKRLIEDLFLLAEVEDPEWKTNPQAVDTLAVIRGERERLAELHPTYRRLKVVIEDEAGDSSVPGEPYLLRRLLGNAIENACQHARRKVVVRLEPGDDGSLDIRIRDDGGGFTLEAMEAFGRKRTSRFLDGSHEGKVSLGLGSVIMKTVAEAHGGRVTPGNWSGGAEIRISLPRGRADAPRKISRAA